MNSVININTFEGYGLDSRKNTIPTKYREEIIRNLETQYGIKIENQVHDTRND